MQDCEKLKGKFTQRWLSRSNEYYSPIFSRLFYAQCRYLDKKGYCFPSELLTAIFNAAKEGEALEDIEGIDELIAPLKDSIKAKGEAFDMNEFRAMALIQLGLGDFVEIETSINVLNRGFIKLLEAAEPLAAMPLIRLQLENLTFLKAELMYPFRELYRVFNEGKQKSDILETLQAYVFLTTEALKKEAETDSKNMFHLNLLLIKIAKKQIALQKAIIWQNAKQMKFYKKVLADIVRMINLELQKEY